MPIEDLGMRIGKFAFGQPAEVLRSLEGIEASVEGENNGGKDDGGDGDMDSTVSGDDDDLKQVEAAWLTAESQQTHNSTRTQRNNLPVLPGQLTNPQTPCHEVPRMNRRHQRITFEPKNISQTHKVKVTYLEHANAMRSMWWPGN